MPRRRNERAKAEIETGSFSDISFLLIIFFVLTTTFEKAVGRAVDIPSAAPPERQVQEEEKKTPTVTVMADRILFGMGEGVYNRGGLRGGPLNLPDFGETNDQEANTPLGSGIALLAGLGAAYLVAKRRKEE